MRSVKKLKCGSNTVRDGPAVHSNDTQAEQGEGGRSEVVEKQLPRCSEAMLAAGVVRAACATRTLACFHKNL